jgi:FkbM family methyltransferase
LIHSNAPWVPSGYGTQCALWAPRLASLGHDVAVSAYFGLRGGMLEWRGLPVYPSGQAPYGGDVVGMHARHFAADLVLLLADLWCVPHETLTGLNVAAWMPIDCEPMGMMDAGRLKAYGGAIPVAMSRFGEKQLTDAGFDPVFYVPHGIDTSVFRPPEDRRGLREAMGVDGKFVIFMNAANMDKQRKAFPEQVAAFARLHARHPDTLLILHTITETSFGVDVQEVVSRAGVADAVKFSSQYLMTAGLVDQDMLAASYGAADLVTSCSYGEGFGLPIVEAQACFPAETPISAANVVTGMERVYTGELIRIEAGNGTILEATAEHPFWTETRGWVPAAALSCDDRLLYVGDHAEQGNIDSYAGRAGDVARAIRTDAAARGGQAHGQNLRVMPVARPQDGAAQVVRAALSSPFSFGHARAAGLYRGPDRRRGDRVHPAVRQEVEADYPHRQHVLASHGVAVRGLPAAIGLHRAQTAQATQSPELHVSHPGAGSPAALRGTDSRARHQATADGMRGRVHPRAADAAQIDPGVGAPTGTDRYRARPEYQAIRSLSRRAVRELPVYNLTTFSGTYSAGGFLVHNCGTPVVVTGFSAMTETGAGGWKVGGEKFYLPQQHSWWVMPSIGAIYRAYEKAYQRGPAYQAKKAAAREHALAYDVERVLAEHWKPALEGILEAFRPVSKVVEFAGLKWQIDDPRKIFSDSLALSHESAIDHEVLDRVPEGGVFADVGAHVGHYALRAAAKASKVVAVEANPDTAGRLEHNLGLNGITNVTVHPVAAWDERARMNLLSPHACPRDGSTQVLAASDGDEGFVDGLPLDDILSGLDRLDLVKLDVEGADLHALRGMAGTLARLRPVLFIEDHSIYGYYERDELNKLLEKLGYRWHDPFHGYLIAEPEQEENR